MKDCLVTYLRLRHHGSLTITEGREVKALLLLLVPLLEELLHAPGGQPQHQGSGRHLAVHW